jgi:uncharacterized protein YjbI with pentapeptide repeats
MRKTRNLGLTRLDEWIASLKTIPISTLVAIVLIASTINAVWRLPQWQANSVPSITEKERANLENANRSTLVQAIGGLFFFVTAYFTWRNLQATEDKQMTERFSKAIEQLGNDKIEVRFGAIYSLERIAKDSPKDHWTIMEILTSFIQEKSPLLPTDKGLQEKPLKITKDIQAAVSVIRRRDASKDPEHLRLDLRSVNLRGASLAAYLLEDKYITANFKRIDFYGVCLHEADLNASNLSEANLIKADLSYAMLEGASLENANLNFATLVETNFSEASLKKANFERSNLEKALLNKTDARAANFFCAHLSGASFKESNLQIAKLQLANLEESYLKKTDLTGADLRGTSLVRADLTEANLRNTNLQEANFMEADLRGTDFSMANLSKADFRNAKNLTPEQVKAAQNWEQAIYNQDLCKKLGLPLKAEVEQSRE